MAKGKPKHGGKRHGAGRKVGDTDKDPRALMKDLGYADHWLSPLEFCLAVMNGDTVLLKHDTRGKNRKLTIGQRIEAARIAAPFLHQKMPELVEQNVTHSWADMLREAEERERTMRAQYEQASPSTRTLQ